MLSRRLLSLKIFRRALNLAAEKQRSENNVVSSRVPDIEISNLSLHEYAWKDLNRWHDKIALVSAETGRHYTYYEVYRKSNGLSSFLRNSLNLNVGDTVAVLLPNVPEYPIVVLGTIQAGLKITTINPIFTVDEIKRQISDSNSKVIFTLPDLYNNVKQALHLLHSKIPVIIISQTQIESIPQGTIKFDEVANKNENIHFESANNNEIACLPYSSGTTGLPKGVKLSHRNIVSNLQQMAAPEFRLNLDTEGAHQDVIPLILPMYHIYGLVVVMLNMFSQGCKLVTASKFSSHIFIKILKEHKPTVFYVVPPIMLMLLNNDHIKLQHLETLRQLVCSAAPLGVADIGRFYEKTRNKVNFMQVYGMTEASPIILHQSNMLTQGVKVGASGLLVPNTKCKVVDIDDLQNKPLEVFKSGELLVKGPQIMNGYHNQEQATSNSFFKDRWLRTGDIAHYDEDGQFYITDRLKELIKVKGFQVAPAELEEILRDHPSVADAAVIGIAHTEFGEVPKAFVVPKIGSIVTSDHIKEYVANKVAKYKQLSGGVVILDSIPKTASGKILRRQLKLL